MATARRFALAMGMMAVAVVCVVGIWRQAALQETLLRALVALVVFAAIGYACGLLGAAIMKDAVKTELTRVRETLDARGGIGKAGSGRGDAGSGVTKPGPSDEAGAPRS